eukprot:m.81952 g.81952  ORF g.81952 m.81952 type:complete len:52 (+) comp11045_c0_seq1:1397-1552(+)
MCFWLQVLTVGNLTLLQAVSSEHTAVEIENAVKTLGDIFRSVNAGHGGLSM